MWRKKRKTTYMATFLVNLKKVNEPTININGRWDALDYAKSRCMYLLGDSGIRAHMITGDEIIDYDCGHPFNYIVSMCFSADEDDIRRIRDAFIGYDIRLMMDKRPAFGLLILISCKDKGI